MSGDHTKSVLLQNQAMLAALMAQLAKKGYLNDTDRQEILEMASLFLSGGTADEEMALKRLKSAFGPAREPEH